MKIRKVSGISGQQTGWDVPEDWPLIPIHKWPISILVSKLHPACSSLPDQVHLPKERNKDDFGGGLGGGAITFQQTSAIFNFSGRCLRFKRQFQPMKLRAAVIECTSRRRLSPTFLVETGPPTHTLADILLCPVTVWRGSAISNSCRAVCLTYSSSHLENTQLVTKLFWTQFTAHFSGVWGWFRNSGPLTSARVMRLKPYSLFRKTDNYQEHKRRR